MEGVTKPATKEWTAGRLAVLLSHYWVSDMPQELREAISNDWLEVVMSDPCPPDWAIQKACVRWLSGKDARKRPMPGDVRNLAIEEMGWVYSVKSRLFLEDNPSAISWHPYSKYLDTNDATEPSNEITVPKLQRL